MTKLTYDEVTKLVAVNNQSGQDDTAVIAVIYKESRFDPAVAAATSSATGLMQMTKGAVTEVDRVRKTTYLHSAMTLPTTNIMVRSICLSIRIGRAGGDLANGLDGFGTGPGYSASILRAAGRLKKGDNPTKVLTEEIGKP